MRERINSGLSHNKCLISKRGYYPHHCYYYEGTNLKDMMVREERGLETDWMGEGQGFCYTDEDAGEDLGREDEANIGHLSSADV